MVWVRMLYMVWVSGGRYHVCCVGVYIFVHGVGVVVMYVVWWVCVWMHVWCVRVGVDIMYVMWV